MEGKKEANPKTPVAAKAEASGCMDKEIKYQLQDMQDRLGNIQEDVKQVRETQTKFIEVQTALKDVPPSAARARFSPGSGYHSREPLFTTPPAAVDLGTPLNQVYTVTSAEQAHPPSA